MKIIRWLMCMVTVRWIITKGPLGPKSYVLFLGPRFLGAPKCERAS